MVEQLADVQRAPQRRLRADQSNLNRVSEALGALAKEMESLLGKAKALKDAQLYHTRGVVSTDSHVATASVASSASTGTYLFNFSQLATAASQRGGLNVGQGLDADADLTSGAAGFGVPVSSGRFTINGQQIDVQAGDSLNDILGRIATQTGLTANYDSGTDKITLSDAGGSPITLGSAADTSNFLQAARLSNNGTSTVASSQALGTINTSATLASARFNTAISSGTFEINGVAFTIDAATDTVADVLNRINQSAAGVIASYDSINDRFTLANKTTGDIGIALTEGMSNFLSAAKLTSSSGGALVNGQDAVFTVNGGASLTSRTNTFGKESHGIEGLTVTALTVGSATVNVSNDTAPLKQAITEFIDQYNKVQSLISVQTASSTDAKGAVTASLLASDLQVTESARKFRSLAASDASGLDSALKRLESLGYETDGYSNTISLANSGALENALANSMSDVQALFGDATNGIASRIGNYLEGLVGTDGSMLRHRDAVASQASRIDEQLGKMERAVLASQETLFESFRRWSRPWRRSTARQPSSTNALA